MKVALIRPRYKTHIVSPPMGMGYVAAYLKKFNHEVKIIDGLNYDLSNDQIVNKCKIFDAQLVGIYCLSAFFLDASDLALKLKKNGMLIMLGGAHPSFLPKYTLEKVPVDFIIIGEAEKTIINVIAALENNQSIDNIPGVYTKKTEKIIQGPIVEDLDEIPFPDWEQIDPRKYKKAPHGGFILHFPYAPMTTTRGCPYRCTFCASPKFSNRTLRKRSPKNIVDEIEYLIKNFEIKEVHFEDDNFTFYRQHAIDVCKEIIQRKIKIVWACPNGIRADRLDPELAHLMKKAGCYYVAFGIESGNQTILNNVKKDITIEQIRNGVQIACNAGIMTQGFFIFGLPGETEKSVEETISFAKSLPLTRAQFLNLDVMPGTELWDTLNFEEKINWDYNSYHDVTWTPDTLSKNILEKAPSRAFRSFYLRPKQLFTIIKYIRLSQLPFLFKRLIDCKILPNISLFKKL